MLNEENRENGFFGYGFRAIRNDDGKITFYPTTVIKNVPIEVVTMQIEVLLKDLKKSYYDQHRGNALKGDN